MAEEKKRTENEKKKIKEMQGRGTNDDFEVLKMIVSENRGLFLRVLDKIRSRRGIGKDSIFDVASKKQEQKFKNTRAKREDVG
jgi:hypothetical protein